jgi:hypothetical protein
MAEVALASASEKQVFSNKYFSEYVRASRYLPYMGRDNELDHHPEVRASGRGRQDHQHPADHPAQGLGRHRLGRSRRR